MPRYQYACPDCGNEFEATQKFTDKPIKKCPTCGKRNVYRVINKVAVAFKGTGFYINDSKSSDHKKASKPKADEKVSTETGADAGAKAGAEASADAGKESVGKDKAATPSTTTDAKTESKSESKAEPKENKKEKPSKSAP